MSSASGSPALVLTADQVAASPILGFERIDLRAVNPDRSPDAWCYEVPRAWITSAGAIDLESVEDGGLLDEVLDPPFGEAQRVASAAAALSDLAATHPIEEVDEAIVDAAVGEAVIAAAGDVQLVAWHGGMAFGAEGAVRDLLEMLAGGFAYEATVAAVGRSTVRVKRAAHLIPEDIRALYFLNLHATVACMQSEIRADNLRRLGRGVHFKL